MDAKRMLESDWLTTPLGRRCLTYEQRLMRRTLDRVFGDYLLQIGVWGERDSFLRYSRVRHSAVIDWRPGSGTDLLSDIEQLGIANDCVDAVLLPHTLELTRSAHGLLREVNRILRPDGDLIILSFDPTSPWGLRRLLSRDGYPPGHRHLFRERRLRDWLQLLSFDVAPAAAYCHALPFEQFRRLVLYPRERFARRWLPFMAGAYMLSAKKQVLPLTPIRPVWRRPRLRAVGGLVEPTARASRTYRECG